MTMERHARVRLSEIIALHAPKAITTSHPLDQRAALEQSMKVKAAQELPKPTVGRPYLAGVSHADQGIVQIL